MPPTGIRGSTSRLREGVQRVFESGWVVRAIRRGCRQAQGSRQLGKDLGEPKFWIWDGNWAAKRRKTPGGSPTEAWTGLRVNMAPFRAVDRLVLYL